MASRSFFLISPLTCSKVQLEVEHQPGPNSDVQVQPDSEAPLPLRLAVQFPPKRPLRVAATGASTNLVPIPQVQFTNLVYNTSESQVPNSDSGLNLRPPSQDSASNKSLISACRSLSERPRYLEGNRDSESFKL